MSLNIQFESEIQRDTKLVTDSDTCLYVYCL